MSRFLRSRQTNPHADAAFSSRFQTSWPHPLPPVGGNSRSCSNTAILETAASNGCVPGQTSSSSLCSLPQEGAEDIASIDNVLFPKNFSAAYGTRLLLETNYS